MPLRTVNGNVCIRLGQKGHKNNLCRYCVCIHRTRIRTSQRPFPSRFYAVQALKRFSVFYYISFLFYLVLRIGVYLHFSRCVHISNILTAFSIFFHSPAPFVLSHFAFLFSLLFPFSFLIPIFFSLCCFGYFISMYVYLTM